MPQNNIKLENLSKETLTEIRNKTNYLLLKKNKDIFNNKTLAQGKQITFFDVKLDNFTKDELLSIVLYYREENRI